MRTRHRVLGVIIGLGVVGGAIYAAVHPEIMKQINTAKIKDIVRDMNESGAKTALQDAIFNGQKALTWGDKSLLIKCSGLNDVNGFYTTLDPKTAEPVATDKTLLSRPQHLHNCAAVLDAATSVKAGPG